MSKVLIVSDSHGLTKELEDLRERHGKEVELMIHCGDSQLMPTDQAISGYLTVYGELRFWRLSTWRRLRRLRPGGFLSHMDISIL